MAMSMRRRYILPSLIMGAKKIEIEIETATFAAKIDRNRLFLKKSQPTQHYKISYINAVVHESFLEVLHNG